MNKLIDFPDNLLKRVKESAKVNKRSFVAEALVLIEKGLKKK